MLRSIRIGLFIGILIGMSACAATTERGPQSGAYGSVEVGRTR